VNETARELYRALGYVPAPHTMLEGIHKLPPAHLLIAEGAGIDVRAYWSPAAAAGQPSRLASAADLRATLLAAVERELMSDVPLGVFTSGGLDSSFLVGAAARVLPGERIHTYAVRFVEPGYDESGYAEAVTHDIRSVHHVVTADDAALGRALDVVSKSLAEPLGDPAVLPTYLLAEAARADVKVVLSGEGADELFGGYPTYLGHTAAATWQRLPAFLRRPLRWGVERWPTSTGKVTLEFLLKQFVAAADQPWLERHVAWFGALGPEVAGGGRVVPELACKLHGFPHDDPLNRILWLDFLTYLPDNLLVKVDRATMLASVEARAPFLDRQVLELVLPAPSRLKVRGLTTKVILRQAARGIVPAAVIARRKRGLSVPVARWLNTGLASLADRLLDTSLLAEHRSGKANHGRKLWPLLMLALWAETWHVELEPSLGSANPGALPRGSL
jgi:asparagine synthase (glutamine-hydrolysing)